MWSISFMGSDPYTLISLMQAHKYFACGSLVCMGMAIYSGHKIAPKKKKAEKPEK